jgi:predicted amidophosphoribosyltransferases
MCSESLAFEGAMAVSRYEGRARQGILQLKQAENLNFANYTGAVLGERILQKPDWMMADAIVPVPMQQHQWILRGKNPAERIANAISFVTKIPVRTDLLWKKPGGIPQHTLNAEQRRTNVLQFASAGKSLKGYIFILCDDVLTTGSTANYCASLLKQCGAERVYVATATTTTKIKV